MLSHKERVWIELKFSNSSVDGLVSHLYICQTTILLEHSVVRGREQAG